MHISGKTRRVLFIQNLLYYILLFIIAGLIGWLSMKHIVQFDWSANQRNTLSEISHQAAENIDGALHITAFVTDDEMMRSAIRNLIGRYQHIKKDIKLEFVNPQTNPARTRKLNITSMGEVIIQYGEAEERLQQLNEETITNALLKLARGEERWIVFLTGHNERDPYAKDNAGLSTFTEKASKQGFAIQSLNLVVEQKIPDNTEVLVIASSQKNYLPGEIDIVLDYLRSGSNLLWLTEPETQANLNTIGNELGVQRLPGVVVDSAGQMFGITQPDFVLVVNYPDDEIMRGINEFTLFPQSSALHTKKDNPLKLTASAFLQTLARSWTETGPIEGNIEFNENTDEVAGPIDIGIRLTRTINQADASDSAPTQRIAIIGDGDFLSNAYIGYGSNMLLGINLLNWLSHDDDLVNIDRISAPDTQLTLSNRYIYIISVLFLFVMPLFLIVTGVFIWLKRRKK